MNCIKHFSELSIENGNWGIYPLVPSPIGESFPWELQLPAFLGCTCFRLESNSKQALRQEKGKQSCLCFQQPESCQLSKLTCDCPHSCSQMEVSRGEMTQDPETIFSGRPSWSCVILYVLLLFHSVFIQKTFIEHHCKYSFRHQDTKSSKCAFCLLLFRLKAIRCREHDSLDIQWAPKWIC